MQCCTFAPRRTFARKEAEALVLPLARELPSRSLVEWDPKRACASLADVQDLNWGREEPLDTFSNLKFCRYPRLGD
jgi:hypothetical protein